MTDLRKLAERILAANASRRPRIAVIGDVMLDEHIVCQSRKLCREAEAAPVLLSEDDDAVVTLGGAGNAARQLHHWNADVHLFGLLDPRANGEARRAGINVDASVAMPHGLCSVKRRFYAGDRLVMRHDVECPKFGEPGLDSLRWALLSNLQDAVRAGLDAVILSDYRKGTLSGREVRSILEACRQAGVPTVVDPKLPLVCHYAGCTVLKPNSHYLAESGLTTERLWRLLAGSSVVGTAGASPPFGLHDGVAFACQPRCSSIRPASVVGAGDCFGAHLALCIAHGLPVPEAAEVAHSAGRVFVQRPTSEPVFPCEVAADLDPATGKVLTAGELRRVLDARHHGKRVIFANGCFDLTHVGHADMLQWAKSQGDVLVVAVNSDASVRRLKGDTRPILREADRARMLASLACADYVCLFDEDTPIRLVETVWPSAIIKGSDYLGREADVVGSDLVDEVLIAPDFGLRTSVIVERILAGLPAREVR